MSFLMLRMASTALLAMDVTGQNLANVTTLWYRHEQATPVPMGSFT